MLVKKLPRSICYR